MLDWDLVSHRDLGSLPGAAAPPAGGRGQGGKEGGGTGGWGVVSVFEGTVRFPGLLFSRPDKSSFFNRFCETGKGVAGTPALAVASEQMLSLARRRERRWAKMKERGGHAQRAPSRNGLLLTWLGGECP